MARAKKPAAAKKKPPPSSKPAKSKKGAKQKAAKGNAGEAKPKKAAAPAPRPRPLAQFLTMSGPGGSFTMAIDPGANDELRRIEVDADELPPPCASATLRVAARCLLMSHGGVDTYAASCARCGAEGEVHECEACTSLHCAECIAKAWYECPDAGTYDAAATKPIRDWLREVDMNCPVCTHPF